jgi:hypothetical protein
MIKMDNFFSMDGFLLHNILTLVGDVPIGLVLNYTERG